MEQADPVDCPSGGVVGVVQASPKLHDDSLIDEITDEATVLSEEIQGASKTLDLLKVPQSMKVIDHPIADFCGLRDLQAQQQ